MAMMEQHISFGPSRISGAQRRLAAVVVVVGIGATAACVAPPDPNEANAAIYNSVHDGRLVAADYWGDEPEILSAGLGFDNIIGVEPLDAETVRAVGGTWETGLVCTDGSEPAIRERTSAMSTSTAGLYGSDTYLDDGLPIVFSWPVRTNTISPDAFRFTLNTGEVRVPVGASTAPNWELNERNTVVVFGDLGNRGLPGEPGAEYPVRLDIVVGRKTLVLAGPSGDVAATGLSWTTTSTPYESGPRLVGAKLNRAGTTGEGGSALPIATQKNLPNDELSLYGAELAEQLATTGRGAYRLRMLTTGGFSPDGVVGVRPDEFERYFRLHVDDGASGTILVSTAGVDHEVPGGSLRVIGLSDLGRKIDPSAGVFSDRCYNEDHDNYIDVVIVGDDAAVRGITALEIPAADGYSPFFNPGGPGAQPMPGVRYTAPGPPDIEPVVIAIDDPRRIDR
jgi:hypothetical protein